jgi:hypothetical protein
MTAAWRVGSRLLLAVALSAGAAAAHAQRPVLHGAAAADDGSELARMREAAALEEAGQLDEAVELVRAVLADNPTSLTALLALERLTAVQGRAADVLPAVERLLDADPASVVGQQLRLRVHARTGDVGGIEAAARAWIRAAPDIETPYREVALVWRERREPARAAAVLEDGRRRIDRDDALALELGDAYAADGQLDRAAVEWARAVGADGRGFIVVQRRVQSQPDGGAQVVPPLIEQLSGPPHAAGRRRAAALLAIDAGLETTAHGLAQTLAQNAAPAEREPLLVELARRADGAGLPRLAAWAYGELLREPREDGALLAIRTRVAELALLAGDTATALAAYQQLEDAAAVGSPRRRQALSLRIQLMAREGDAAGAAEALAEFRSEHPHAPELDETAALVARRLLDAGDAAAAERVLAGVTGARSAQLRGRIFIRTGELGQAREQLITAAAGLHGAEATETLALAALAMRLSPAGGDYVASAIAAPDPERARLIGAASADSEHLPAAERAAVLDFMAAIADRVGLAEDGAALRREIVDALPRTHEAPGALLALARRALSGAGGEEEARVLLERLIIDYPRSPLAPAARQELERLRHNAR